ncbi:Choline dehydrogenase [Roseateles sp. YR242]|uniref:alpha/beta fold hydrolase n=1 Tax=Roseateles sp. YR242 TaxID=1855305 RepID=UPI0008CE5469|nr:alpha/beta fold hydrolase [Roseateles sp. YR242]SEK76673.1 Choline dehydrogenase [Roseateles sp. YR242]
MATLSGEAPPAPSENRRSQPPDARPFGTRWLSRPLEDWISAGDEADSPCVDVLIVGSGYGGAASAHALAGRRDAQGRPLRVAVLERGREYLPGAFPSRFADLAGHVRLATTGADAPTGRREGLFDLRLGPDVCVALANGLGGGSLINAGVMERPDPDRFREPGWPAPFLEEDLSPWFDRAERLLGVRDAGGDNTIYRLRGHRARRLEALQVLGGEATRPARIQVAMDDLPRGAAGWKHRACVACGDCATGCNHEAKQSLDTGLLLQAWRAGAELVCGASVEHLEHQPGGGWMVLVQHTDELLRRRQAEPFVVRARRVVLAAGTLGSTEILMRSRRRGLAVSRLLGQRFSGNGDVIAVGQGWREPVQAVADEQQPFAMRQVGPTITGVLQGGPDFVVEDLAVPGALRPLFEESFAFAATLDALGRANPGPHEERAEFDDPFAVRPAVTERYLPLAIIGKDSGTGTLVLPEDSEEPGVLGVCWPGLKSEPDIARRHAWIERRLQHEQARLLRNPMWQLLPPEMAFLVNDARGPMISVHPLGGCAMGDRGSDGVVNDLGQVFRAEGTSVYEDLVVLDGAIVPGSLAINPALTITALALRALGRLSALWGLDAGTGPQRQEAPRPQFRTVTAPRAETPTTVEVRERLGGFVRWPGAPGSAVKYLELGFVYQPKGLADLLRPGPQRQLDAAPGSFLRLYEARETSPGHFEVMGPGPGDGRLWWHKERGERAAVLSIPLAAGTLTPFQREASSALRRHARGLAAWFMNRGYRDAVQGALDWLSSRSAPRRPGEPKAGLWARVVNAWHLSGHAGEVRLMRYDLRVAPDLPLPDWAARLAGVRLTGHKRISYTRRGNPWTQLSRLTLAPAAGLLPAPGQPAIVLELDLHYLARERMPLLRIRQAQDAPSAIRDVGALMAYVARMTIGLHAWTFRKPDVAPPRRIDRLPGAVPDLPTPTILEMAAGRWGDAGRQREDLKQRPGPDDDRPVLVRLTRYARPGGMPVLMLHGYSASGTTFAHHSVQPGPAKILWDAGYDVWIVDMRTSAGMATAKLPWTFEESAFNDIPLAIDRVLRETGREKLCVFAHCMGSVMLHMALLEEREQPWEHFFPLRRRLASRISKLVISQVTPLMVMSPTNSLRGVLMQHLRPYLPLQDFSFRPEGLPTLLDQVMDRLLSSLPYPDAEFDIENPPPPRIRRTPWTATRHRMDLLYGRDFAITNVDTPVFDFIDDHFGPLNMDTVAQAVHFARCHEITDWQGASLYLDSLAKSLALLDDFPVLSLHGEDNGLCSAESAELLKDYYDQAAPGRYRYRIIAGHGHQDCLIGRDIATRVFPAVLAFLAEPDLPPSRLAAGGAVSQAPTAVVA